MLRRLQILIERVTLVSQRSPVLIPCHLSLLNTNLSSTGDALSPRQDIFTTRYRISEVLPLARSLIHSLSLTLLMESLSHGVSGDWLRSARERTGGDSPTHSHDTQKPHCRSRG